MIHTIDLHFQDTPGTIAAFLVESQVGPIIIEPGPHSTFPKLQAGIEALGYRVEDVRHVFLTHIHLDHAGAAWAFAAHGAQVYVHPFGKRHLASPEKLMQSARLVFKEAMDRLWGEMRPIPDRQLASAEDLQPFCIGERLFIAHHTPGHARHHIAWQLDNDLFAGDVAGVKLLGGPPQPPCPPPDIDLTLWIQSLHLVRQLNAERLFLTHYGVVTAINEHLDTLERTLTAWATWIRARLDEPNETLVPAFEQFVHASLKPDEQALYEIANPSAMSVDGLRRYWTKDIQGRS